MKYPKAIDRPLGSDLTHQELMRSHDIVCAHTMCGSLAGTDQYFRVVNGIGYVGTEAHIGFGADHTVYGWTDMARTADANLDGKYRVISFESADTGAPFPPWSGSDVPEWTAAQEEEIEDFLVWVCDKEAHAGCPDTWLCHQVGIPPVIIPDSKPGRRGIAPHRLGIDPYRVDGGEHWSTSYGKACCGDRRIAQLHQIVPRVAARLGAQPPEQDWFDMATLADLQAAIRDTKFSIDVGGVERQQTLGLIVKNLEVEQDFIRDQNAKVLAGQADILAAIAALPH